MFRLEASVPELIFRSVLVILIQAWSHAGRICPSPQPLAGVVIGTGHVVLMLLGGLTGSAAGGAPGGQPWGRVPLGRQGHRQLTQHR